MFSLVLKRGGLCFRNPPIAFRFGKSFSTSTEDSKGKVSYADILQAAAAGSPNAQIDLLSYSSTDRIPALVSFAKEQKIPHVVLPNVMLLSSITEKNQNSKEKTILQALELLEPQDETNETSEHIKLQGMLHLRGYYIPKDEKKGVELLEKAGELGNSSALAELGSYYLSKKENINAITYLQSSIEKGNVEAAKSLHGYLYERALKTSQKEVANYGEHLLNGTNSGDLLQRFLFGKFLMAHVEDRKDEGKELVEKCAEEGLPDAQVLMGDYYRKEKTLNPDSADKFMKQSVTWFERARDQAFGPALISLATLHLKGDGVPVDHKIAYDYVLAALLEGYTNAHFVLGTMYLQGYHVQKSKELAMEQFRAGVKLGGDDEHIVNCGYTLASVGLFDDAIELLSPLCSYHPLVNYVVGHSLVQKQSPDCLSFLEEGRKQKNTDSMGLLGALYYNGKLVEKDVEKAKMYWMEGSALGNASCSASLGKYYWEHGDPKEGVVLLEQAAAKGNLDACVTLGPLLMYGHPHLPKDEAKGIHMVKQAAKQRPELYNVLYFKLIKQGKNTEAFECAKLGALAGHVPSMVHVGNAYFTGDGCDQDFTEAVTHFERAAEHGNDMAMFTAGMIHLSGKNGTKDERKGFAYILQSAVAGNMMAQTTVGNLYWTGSELVPVNREQSRVWWTKAAELGDASAMYALGELLLSLEDKKEHEQGMKWIEKAAAKGHKDAQFKLNDE